MPYWVSRLHLSGALDNMRRIKLASILNRLHTKRSPQWSAQLDLSPVLWICTSIRTSCQTSSPLVCSTSEVLLTPKQKFRHGWRQPVWSSCLEPFKVYLPDDLGFTGINKRFIVDTGLLNSSLKWFMQSSYERIIGLAGSFITLPAAGFLRPVTLLSRQRLWLLPMTKALFVPLHFITQYYLRFLLGVLVSWYFRSLGISFYLPLGESNLRYSWARIFFGFCCWVQAIFDLLPIFARILGA